MSIYVPTFTSTLTASQLTSIKLAIEFRLERYAAEPPYFDVDAAPAASHIGTLRELLANIEAIQLGNRRGGNNPFDIRMVQS